jgi:hypothetical protein
MNDLLFMKLHATRNFSLSWHTQPFCCFLFEANSKSQRSNSLEVVHEAPCEVGVDLHSLADGLAQVVKVAPAAAAAAAAAAMSHQLTKEPCLHP